MAAPTLPVIFVIMDRVENIPEPIMRPMLKVSVIWEGFRKMTEQGAYIRRVVENTPR